MKKLLPFIQGIPTQYENGIKRLAVRAASANGHQPETIHYDRIEHGLFVLCTTFLNSLLLMAAILTLKLHFLQMAWFILVYASLRLVSFGVHFKHIWSCLLMSMLYYLGGYYISQMSLPTQARAVVIGLASLVFIQYAPYVEPERPPLSGKAHRKARRRAMFLLILYGVLSLLLSHPYNNLASASIVCQSINLLPIWRRGGESQ